ncbi:MAG TPA: site-2 protease family protein [Candidatus Paceibacterota bacterium]
MTERAERPLHIGLLVILIKLGPKLLPVFYKLWEVFFQLAKGIISFKALGGILSVGLYTYLFTWQMGVSLVAFILLHEYGHLWAMKKCGIKTRGIYLIPGFGGVALAEEGFKSGRNEAFIAIMGPVFGIFFVVPMAILYFYTKDLLWVAIASSMLFINLFNLFPIIPLDGGRIVKAIIFSLKESSGFFFMIASFATAMCFGLYFKMSLLFVVAFAGLIEALADYGLQEKLEKLKLTALRILGVSMFVVILQNILVTVENGPFGVHFALPDTLGFLGLIGVGAMGILVVIFCRDIVRSTNGKIATYPLVLIRDTFRGITETRSLKHEDLKLVKAHVQMNKKQLGFYSTAFILLILLHVVLVIFAANVSQFSLITDILD